MIGYLKSRVRNNLPIKVIALLLGCIIWYILSAHHTMNIWLKVPLCFYNQSDEIILESPETLDVHISGLRSSLYSIHPDILAVHINAQSLHAGDNYLVIDAAQLLLPDTIKLLNYYPMNIKVHVNIKS